MVTTGIVLVNESHSFFQRNGFPKKFHEGVGDQAQKKTRHVAMQLVRMALGKHSYRGASSKKIQTHKC